METVCHVRGEENYWLKNNPPFFFTSSQKEDVFYTILDIWNKNLKVYTNPQLFQEYFSI